MYGTLDRCRQDRKTGLHVQTPVPLEYWAITGQYREENEPEAVFRVGEKEKRNERERSG